MKAYVFPGQGAQFPGMGKDLFEAHASIRDLFAAANDILGYNLTEVMFTGSEEELKQTRITQPAIFLYSLGRARLAADTFQPQGEIGRAHV